MADDPKPDPTPDPQPDPKPDPDPQPDPDRTDWKREARKHEDRAKQAAKRAAELEEQLKTRDDADKSEQEKAIEAAREEGRQEAAKAAEVERRADRLSAAVHRLAAKGITVGEGDDAAAFRFRDPEDAARHLPANTDDLFTSEGQVDTDALTATLRDTLTEKPYLRADDPGKPSGDADARKGQPADDPESLSPEDHERRMYPENFK